MKNCLGLFKDVLDIEGLVIFIQGSDIYSLMENLSYLYIPLGGLWRGFSTVNSVPCPNFVFRKGVSNAFESVTNVGEIMFFIEQGGEEKCSEDLF